MNRRFSHERVAMMIINTLYIAGGIILLIMIFSNVKAETQRFDSYSGATEVIDCMNCDEID
tara:strand:+ start:188 stop:370 length:183 start_codon:yes stop_codon:yes gene_type:complete